MRVVEQAAEAILTFTRYAESGRGFEFFSSDLPTAADLVEEALGGWRHPRFVPLCRAALQRAGAWGEKGPDGTVRHEMRPEGGPPSRDAAQGALAASNGKHNKGRDHRSNGRIVT